VSAVRECVVLWGVAAGLAALGTAVLFEAAAGLNWGLWTIGAAGAVAVWTRRSGAHLSASLLVVLWLAGMLGVGAAVTADGLFHVLIAAAVMALLAMAMLLAGDPRWARVNLPFMLCAPLVASLHGLAEAVRRATELVAFVTTRGNRPPLRGAALALPVVALFGLILANADPVLATLRDDLVEALTRLAFVPRLKFFATLLIAAVGGGGIILRREPVRIPGSAAPAARARLGDTERASSSWPPSPRCLRRSCSFSSPISSATRRPRSGAGSPSRNTRAEGSRSSPPWRHSARCWSCSSSAGPRAEPARRGRASPPWP
jgi:hypothetical protein